MEIVKLYANICVQRNNVREYHILDELLLKWGNDNFEYNFWNKLRWLNFKNTVIERIGRDYRGLLIDK